MLPDVAVLWWLPLAAFVVLVAWLQGLHGDLWLADHLYAWEGGHWSLRSHWLGERVLHTGARRVLVAVWLGLLLAWVATLSRRQWHRWRRPLGYLVLTLLACSAVVAGLKSISHAACPWDLARYGGTLPSRSVLHAPAGTHGRCFPAGHAGAGYAWMSLFFFLGAVRPTWRRRGLAAGIGLGLLLGIDQQLRGAHFLSHDVSAAMICWSIALGLHLLVLRPRGAGGTA